MGRCFGSDSIVAPIFQNEASGNDISCVNGLLIAEDFDLLFHSFSILLTSVVSNYVCL